MVIEVLISTFEVLSQKQEVCDLLIRLGEMIRDVAQATFGFYSIGTNFGTKQHKRKKNLMVMKSREI